MESFQDIIAELDIMLADGAPAAELAEAVDKLHRMGQSPIAAQRANCAKLLDIETARKWPKECAAAFAAFVMNMPCIPLPASYPCGQKELFIAEALVDSAVPKELRIHLWRTLVMEGYKFPCYTGREWKEIPLALYDIPNVRAWICLTKQPGWEDVRCSDPVFFGSDPRKSFTKEYEKKALEAIDKDSPSGLLMPLSIEGRELPAKYAQATLASRAIKIATYLYCNNKKFSRLFSAQQLLFYVCANWNNDDTIPFIAMLEKDNPGLVKNTMDAFGHDALWYTLYQRDRFNRATTAARHALDPLDQTLIEFGCDPDRPNSIGLSYNNLTVSS